MKILKIVMYSFLLVLLSQLNSVASISDYCAVPPFIGTAVQPNVLFAIDTSGSMGWCAYNPDSNKEYCCNYSSGCGWTYQGNEEGYFDPDKVYEFYCTSWRGRWCRDGYWQETTGTPSTCPKRASDINESNIYSGSCLNFIYMSRIDLVRWAITGGKLESCTWPQINRCDPETYGNPGSQVSCDSYGCILETSDGVKVKVPWNRINEGLAFKFKDLSTTPRLGVLFFSGYGVRSDKVYIGDFTASANFDGLNPYKNLITYVNYEYASGATPTGPAMWDAYNYFAQNDPEYGGFTPQQGSGDKWRNPMYQCFDENDNGVCEGSELTLVQCAKNFVILMTDGQWNVGGNPGWVGVTCSIDTGFERHSADPVVPAYWMHKGFTNSKTGIDTNIESVYTIGLWLGGTGENALKNVAMYGSFDTLHGDWPDALSNYPSSTCGPVDDCCDGSNCGKGGQCTSLPPSSSDWDHNNDGVPDTFYSATSARELRSAINKAIIDILKRTSSGTAVSVLSTSTRGSAYLSQAYFIPSKTSASGEDLTWIGEMKGLWVDLFGQIREDTDQSHDITNSVAQLEYSEDYVAKFFFDTTDSQTKVHLYTSDSTGKVESPCTPTTTRLLDTNNANLLLRTIWNVGEKLWGKSPSSRKIYTSLDASSLTELTAESSTASLLKPYLRAYDDTDALNIIKYVRGEDVDICLDSDDGTCSSTGHRNRSLTVDSVTHVWKLGDIVYSNPRVLSHFPLGTYDIRYNDTTYKDFTREKVYDPTLTDPVKRNDYLFVGANDGMLHCFYMGRIKENPDLANYPNVKAAVIKPSGASYDVGEEVWAYIPMNVLPYLKYLAYTDYCHIYYVDQRSMLLDASINGSASADKTKDSWRTILIGELRFGGNPNPPSGSPTVNGKTVGLSSIFALDITDPENPSLLWEFSDSGLGFTISYPTVVRIGDASKNGNWYVVVGSGPTDYSGDTPPSQGYIYVINLRDGSLAGKLPLPAANSYTGDCVAVDPESDYSVDAIYCGTAEKQPNGDITGRMVRILTGEAVPVKDANDIITNWTVTTLVNTDGPITASPEFAFDSQGNLWCYFGTGKYFGETDKTSTNQQYIYGVKDTCWGYNNGTWEYGSSCNAVTSIFDTTNVVVSATAADYVCMCEGGEADCKDGNGGCLSTGSCSGAVKVVTKVTGVTVSNCSSYTDWQACANYIANNYDGWRISLSTSSPAERVIAKPSVIGQVAMFTTFTPNSDVCGFGGNSYLYSLYYRAGIPYKQPTILKEEAYLNGILEKSVSLGQGAPAIGEGIVSKKVGRKLKTYIQLSTGQIVELTNQPVFLPSKIQFWIER